MISLFKKLRHACVVVYFLPLYISKHLFRFFSVRKKVVFCNFNGLGFGENPRYIAEEILRQDLGYDLVWLVRDMKMNMPNGIRKVKFNSIKAVYELSSAKIIINNVKNGLPYKKKNIQYYIQTWHGEFPLKYIEGECETLLDPRYVAESKADSAITDLILSGCRIDSEIFQQHFWYSGEIMEQGIPRNDVFFHDNSFNINSTKEKLGIKKKCRIAMYAPTFRDDGNGTAYNLNVTLLIDSLTKKTGEEWALIIRMHPNAKKYARQYEYNEKIINGSIVSNPQDLVLISDLLITDYSSIMVDFMIMRKPIFLYAPDVDEYERTRGLRPVYHELPFVRAKNNEDFFLAISKLNFNTYNSIIDRFVRERVQSFDTGHASESVVNKIIKVMNNSFLK